MGRAGRGIGEQNLDVMSVLNGRGVCRNVPRWCGKEASATPECASSAPVSIGEIGISGVAGALSNAVHHVTGRRVRDLPVTLDKLL